MSSTLINELVSKVIQILKDFFDMPSTQEIKNIDWSSIQDILSTIGTWFIVITFSAFGLWLIRAIGLYKMARKKEDKFAFFAFIPYGCLFIMGRILGNTKLFGITIDYPEYLLPALLLSTTFPFSATLSTVLFVFFYYGILYKLYKEKWKGFATVATIISIFIPLLQPFFIFFIKNM